MPRNPPKSLQPCSSRGVQDSKWPAQASTCGAYPTLFVYQGCLGGPETQIRARQGSCFVEILSNPWVAPPEAGKRTSQAYSAELFWPWPSCKGVWAVRKHKIRASKGSAYAEIIAILRVAHAEKRRRPIFKIDLSGLTRSCRAIST